MLLPSAMPCDGIQIASSKPSRPLLRRFMPYSGSSTASGLVPTLSTIQESATLAPVVDSTNVSGYSSPLLSPSSISSSIQSTCRALQSLLGVTPSPGASTPKRNKIPPPPASSPSRSIPIHETRTTVRRASPIRPPMPPRGKNKRTRDDYESLDLDTAMDIDNQGSFAAQYRTTHGHGYSYDSGYHGGSSSDCSPSEETDLSTKLFSTPKRRRRLPGPDHLPFGLERQDFFDLQDPDSNAAYETPHSFMAVSPVAMQQQQQQQISMLHTPGDQNSNRVEDDSEEGDEGNEAYWTPQDDANLITVVLEKVKLSRRDWEECARILGAQGEGVELGRRWRWLMEEGRVGLKMREQGRNERIRVKTDRQREEGRRDVRMVF